jgi:alpha/beta superfamily hydrolase
MTPAAAVRERPVILRVGDEHVFAIVTEPATAPAGPRAGVVFLTRPRAHRNRMWVEAARAMAARGTTAIRFDYHGEGDSTGTPRYLNPEAPYGDEAAAVMRHLVEREGVERVGIVGSCFDARTALAAVHSAPRYDALVFMSAPVLDDSGEMERIVAERDLAHYARRLREPGAWRALVSQARLGLAARVLLARVTRRLRLRARAGTNGAGAAHGAGAGAGSESALDDTPLAAPPGGPTVSAGFARDLRALAARGAPALFLYGDRDTQFPGFRLAMDRELPRLSPEACACFAFVVLSGEAHGYLSIPIQRQIVEHTVSWLERTLRAPERTGEGGP